MSRHENLKSKEAFKEETYISDNCFCDKNEIRTHNHFLVHKRTLNHLAKLAKLAKWLSVRLRTKWLWVPILLLSLKLQVWRLLRARSSLTFRQTIECGFTLKLVRDMIKTYSHNCFSQTGFLFKIFEFFLPKCLLQCCF